jgi:hypothetical protein
MKLGQTGRDRITGFVGVATGIVDYISGCNQVLLTPPIDDKGALREAQWFDVQRVEQIAEAPTIRLENSVSPGPDLPAPKR